MNSVLADIRSRIGIMNIYLDTNILFADPFFKSSYSELLLKSSAEKKVRLYIPNICLNELFFKLTDRAKRLDNDLKNKVRELNKWTNSEITEPKFDLKEYENRIQQFYKEKIENKIFIQLSYKEEFFKENLEKAIRGIPPFFTDKKEEFRDGLIWSTIREHALNEKNIKKYFLTANYADYWNHEKTDFHPNLKKECVDIVIVDNVKELFDTERSLIDFKKIQEFKQWFDKQKITIESVQHAINNYLWNYIADDLDTAIKKFPIKGLKSGYETGYIVPELFKENYRLEKIVKITPVEDFAILEIDSRLNFDGKLFLPNYKKGDFSIFESLTFKASVRLFISYDIDSLFKPITVTVTDIEVE